MDGATLTRWAVGLQWLFDLRDAAVHFKEEQAEVVPHPSGITNSSAIHLSYCVENAERAVDLLLDVLNHAVSSPRPTKPNVVKWADDFREMVERLWGYGNQA